MIIANALATGNHAIVFNPATVNLLANKLTLDKKTHDEKIRKFVVDGEILSYLFWGLLEAPGKETVLNKIISTQFSKPLEGNKGEYRTVDKIRKVLTLPYELGFNIISPIFD